MNKDAQGRRKVERSESNWKCGVSAFLKLVKFLNGRKRLRLDTVKKSLKDFRLLGDAMILKGDDAYDFGEKTK